jgi:hypothetical protein
MYAEGRAVGKPEHCNKTFYEKCFDSGARSLNSAAIGIRRAPQP